MKALLKSQSEKPIRVRAVLGMRQTFAAACVLALLGVGAGPAAAGDYYTNVSGHHVHRPVHSNHRPAGATAQCRDGTYSFSEHHQGTCSHHGGVANWV